LTSFIVVHILVIDDAESNICKNPRSGALENDALVDKPLPLERFFGFKWWPLSVHKSDFGGSVWLLWYGPWQRNK